jgi:glycine cleavage system aminomethyltransferase T
MPGRHSGRPIEQGDSAVPADAFDLGRLVPDYGDLQGEVAACRGAAALFDFSFMTAARVSGRDALMTLARLTDRRLDDLVPGSIRYALCREPDGRLRSDLTVWNKGGGDYLVMSGLRRDIAELVAAAETAGLRASVESLADATAVYAIQGPDSLDVLDGLVDTGRLASLPYFGFAEFDVAGAPCLVGRLGYTGERGFEIVLRASDRDRLWQELSARARPSGFAAADCLRIEAGFVLFANEFRLPVTAAEAGLEAFGGTDPAPPRLRLVCFRAESDEPPAPWRPPPDIGAPRPGTITITSACHSAVAGGALGLGYVLIGESGIGRAFADPTGRFRGVRTVPRPFYDTAKRRPRGAWR